MAINIFRNILTDRLHIERTAEPSVEYGVVSDTPYFDIDTHNRKDIEDAIDEMDEKDPIVNAALSAIAEDAAYFSDPKSPTGFTVRSDDKKVLEEINALIDRSGLSRNAFDILRSMVKYGNVFLEIVYSADGKTINRIKQFPYPHWITRNEDEYGNLKRGSASVAIERNAKGIAPYDEVKDGVKYITSFDVNQICHIRHDNVAGKTYGYPRLGAAISTWKTYRFIRDNIALKSSISGSFTRVHKIPMPWALSEEDQKSEIRKYRANYGTKSSASVSGSDITLNRIPKIPLDVYIPTKYRSNGDPIGPEIDLINYPDYEHDFEQVDMWINMILTCLRVPPSYIYWRLYQGGSERSTNVDMIDKQYARTLRRLQNDFVESVRSIIDMQLGLKGIIGDYEIIVPNVYPQGDRENARLTQVQAQAISMGLDAGVDPKWWISRVTGLPEEDIPMVSKTDDTATTPSISKPVGRPRAEED